MTSFRVESFNAETGELQHTAALFSKEALIEHCTTDWRRGSVHVVYMLHPGIPPRMYAVFVDGRCVSPILNDLI